MSYPNVTNVTNVTNSPQSFFLLGGRNREHMVTSSIVFLFPNLDNWPGNRNTRNTPLEGCSGVPSAKSRILSRDEPEDVCCVALRAAPLRGRRAQLSSRAKPLRKKRRWPL